MREARQGDGVGIVAQWMPAEMTAALDCWRNKMVAAIDEVVQRLKAEAVETPTPAWILER